MSKKNSSYFLLKKSEPQKFSQLQPEPHHSLRYKKKIMQKTVQEVERKPPETDKLLGQGAYWNVNGLPKSIPKNVLLYYSWPYPIFICPSIIGGLLYSSISSAPGLTFVWVAIPNRVKSIFVLYSRRFCRWNYNNVLYTIIFKGIPSGKKFLAGFTPWALELYSALSR